MVIRSAYILFAGVRYLAFLFLGMIFLSCKPNYGDTESEKRNNALYYLYMTVKGDEYWSRDEVRRFCNSLEKEHKVIYGNKTETFEIYYEEKESSQTHYQYAFYVNQAKGYTLSVQIEGDFCDNIKLRNKYYCFDRDLEERDYCTDKKILNKSEPKYTCTVSYPTIKSHFLSFSFDYLKKTSRCKITVTGTPIP